MVALVTVRAEGARVRAESDTTGAGDRVRFPRGAPREPENRTRAGRARRPTATSNFGAGRRESHDATAFYERFEAPTLSGDDAVVEPYEIAEPFVHGDARHMDTVVDGSVALVVTSPPYFAGKQYEEELERDGVPSSYVEYLQLLTDVFAECARKLEPGGRIAVNVANLGRKPYRSLAADVIHILQDDLQLLLRGEVVWRKGEGAAGSCAWGSFRSAANPVLRDITERVVIASKGRFDRALSRAERERRGLPSENTIDADEFMAATLDVWDIEPESARRVSHPAPFPVGLPGRLIDLYTYENDLVLDPFMGSGSTLVAAARRGRRYVGYDLDPTYVDIARLRVRDEGNRRRADRDRRDRDRRPTTSTKPTTSKRARRRKARPRRRSPRSCSPRPASRSSPRTSGCAAPASRSTSSPPTPTTSSGTSTCRARSRARAAGCCAPTPCGRRSAARTCLRTKLNGPLVFLTSHLPRKGSEGDVALKKVAEQGGFFDAIEMRSAEGYERLRKYAAGGHSEGPALRLPRVVADLKTAITEIVTGLGMCGADDVEPALDAAPARAAQRRATTTGSACSDAWTRRHASRPVRRVVDERAGVPRTRATRCAAGCRSSSSGRARTARSATKPCRPTCASTTCTSSAASTSRASS